MGILDDAIREHLELKRQHGARDEEITRKEAEAFGPARQDVAAESGVAPVEQETVLLEPGLEPPDAAPDDPYAVHPGDHPVPDEHHEGEAGGKDPAWREDSDVFAEPEPAPDVGEAGAGTLPEAGPGDPGPPPRQEEPHPAFEEDDHLRGETHAPEPVFGHAPEAPVAPSEPQPAEPGPPTE